ncbi:hypothetical protein N1851_023441 [Merluccius polli]|uniref:Uncharacterized protein n=1 Tax=Merluccius polli TaxID=89951 RepID=A0AA47NWM7_MERPO|nr:hypothetical protein N1851_023441 [Merluccius polli]
MNWELSLNSISPRVTKNRAQTVTELYITPGNQELRQDGTEDNGTLAKQGTTPTATIWSQDYVVKYSNKPNSKEWVFLCLLCGRNLGGKESIAHVISYEHAKNFLEKAHCGSLDCGDVSRETLLDLAEQAAKIHPVSEIQMINLDVPLLDFEYLNVVQMLQTVKWRQSNCELIPVLAAGKKLCK